MEQYARLVEYVKAMKLTVITNNIDYSNIMIYSKDINRPGLQLSGFLDCYDSKRIEVLGNAEVMYLKTIDEDTRKKRYLQLFEKGTPCFVFCRGLQPDTLFLELAEEKGIPVFSTEKDTSNFISNSIQWLNRHLGAVLTIHGCLVDIYGTGVLIRGESGIGKSETTLELLRRGHRLIADDAVEIHKASDETLFGKAPDNIRDFIELRGVGIINIKRLFGVQSILETQRVDLSVTLDEWNDETVYDRLGLEDHYVEILGNRITNYSIPVRTGRNLAIILETAALNYRQKQMGYSAAQDFIEKTKKMFETKEKEE